MKDFKTGAVRWSEWGRRQERHWLLSEQLGVLWVGRIGEGGAKGMGAGNQQQRRALLTHLAAELALGFQFSVHL